MSKNSVFLIVFISLFCKNAVPQSLRVSENKRYLETSDGKPFLWIGDTAWELFHKLSKKEAFRYLEKRSKQGFTVIQAVILPESDGLRTPNKEGELPFINMSPEQPNDNYFKHIDAIVNKAAELGLYIALLPAWADKVPSDRPGYGPVVFNTKNAAIYGSFLSRRYTQDHIIWILGGDRNILNDECFRIWKAMGLAIKNGNPAQQLISYHPAGERSSSAWFQNETWIDFNIYQSGHARHFMPVYEFAASDYDKIPVKPFIDAEPAYEDIPVEFWSFMDFTKRKTFPDSIVNRHGFLVKKEYFKKGFFSDYDIRVHGYWNFLSGACGYTYGHNSVWQMFSKGDTAVVPCLTDWKKAMTRPGAIQMRYIKTLFGMRPFTALIPAQNLIVGPNPAGGTHIRAAGAANGSFYIFYMAQGQTLNIEAAAVPGEVTAWWFNPRNGKRSDADVIRSAGTLSFIPPSSGLNHDWILVIDKV